MQRSSAILGLALLFLVVCTAIIWIALMREDRGRALTVSFLNIGQGDAIFIDAPSGRQALIDGGPSRVVLRELSALMPWYDRSIDVVIATHPDQDHIGGLPDVLARYDVDRIIESSVRDDEGSDAKALETSATKEDAQRLVAHRGHVIDLGDGVRIEILSPDRNVPNVETNLGCLVARLTYGDTSFMLTCDAPDEIEEYLLALGDTVKANVLKAGHHGSKTSSSPSFIKAVAPEWAVFSRGCDNRYGHPAPEIVERYKQRKVPTLDTCLDGRVTFVSDGMSIVRRQGPRP
jgi:competence protein ComEC